jgi:hypothetical protein
MFIYVYVAKKIVTESQKGQANSQQLFDSFHQAASVFRFCGSLKKKNLDFKILYKYFTSFKIISLVKTSLMPYTFN